MPGMRRLALLAALAAAALLPGCGGTTPITIGTGSRAILVLAVDPIPLVASENTIGTASASYKLTITETNGLGGEFAFVSGSVYDPASGNLVALNYYDSADMLVYVGTRRIEANGSVNLTQTVSYTLPTLTKAATLTINVQIKDDKGSTVNASKLVNIE
jgi:hypothetical protein